MTERGGLAIQDDQLYVIQSRGAIFAYVPRFNGWVKLDNNESFMMAVGYDQIYQLRGQDKSIWKYDTRQPGRWARVQNNQETTDTKAIAAGGNNLYRMHDDGQVDVYNTENTEWENIQGLENTHVVKIVAGENDLYQLREDGTIYERNRSSEGWSRLGDIADAKDIVAGGNYVFYLDKDNAVWRYDDDGWKILNDSADTLRFAAGRSGWCAIRKDGVYEYIRSDAKWVRVLEVEAVDLVVGDYVRFVKHKEGGVSMFDGQEWFRLADIPTEDESTY